MYLSCKCWREIADLVAAAEDLPRNLTQLAVSEEPSCPSPLSHYSHGIHSKTPQWMPEIKDSPEPYIHFYLYLPTYL